MFGLSPRSFVKSLNREDQGREVALLIANSGARAQFSRLQVKIRQVAQSIHSTFYRENCPCPPHFAVNGYHGEVRQSRITCDAGEQSGEEHLAVAIGPRVEERVQAPKTEPVPVLPHVSSTGQECCLVQKPDGLKATLPEFAGFMIFPIGPHRDLLTQHPHPLTEITQSQSVWRMARGNAQSRFRLSD